MLKILAKACKNYTMMHNLPYLSHYIALPLQIYHCHYKFTITNLPLQIYHYKFTITTWHDHYHMTYDTAVVSVLQILKSPPTHNSYKNYQIRWTRNFKKRLSHPKWIQNQIYHRHYRCRRAANPSQKSPRSNRKIITIHSNCQKMRCQSAQRVTNWIPCHRIIQRKKIKSMKRISAFVSHLKLRQSAEMKK